MKFFPYSKDSNGLHRFLCVMAFYYKLIPDYAKIIQAFFEREICFFQIIPYFKKSFQQLCDIIFLAHSQSLSVVTNSRLYALGATLPQVIDGILIPIGFLPSIQKDTNQAQAKSFTFRRDFLAA